MENNAQNAVIYLKINRQYTRLLGAVRHWKNLQIAFAENYVWVKNFIDGQENSSILQSIPFRELYYEKEQHLFKVGSLLPTSVLPNVLWTPISTRLAVELPAFNHNFFDFEGVINLTIVSTQQEQVAKALVVDLVDLASYIQTAPKVRLNQLRWCILNDRQALLIGQPLLPLKGLSYWQEGCCLFPTGYGLNFPQLTTAVIKKINPQKSWVLWHNDNSYSLVSYNTLKPLSKSAFNRSYKPL